MADDFPRRWVGPHFKAEQLERERRRRRKTRLELELTSKRQVRDEDRFCRFPLCGCDRERLPWEVAHLRHKGMGGNPTGDRSAPELLIYLCSARHRTSAISLHAGTLHVEPLSAVLGTRGPCAFSVRLDDAWIEVGRERDDLHDFEEFTPEQRRILLDLACLTC